MDKIGILTAAVDQLVGHHPPKVASQDMRVQVPSVAPDALVSLVRTTLRYRVGAGSIPAGGSKPSKNITGRRWSADVHVSTSFAAGPPTGPSSSFFGGFLFCPDAS